MPTAAGGFLPNNPDSHLALADDDGADRTVPSLDSVESGIPSNASREFAVTSAAQAVESATVPKPRPEAKPIPQSELTDVARRATSQERNPGVGLRLPPVRVWGSLAYDLRIEDARQTRTTQHLATTTVSATTYLWQPWFALLGAGVGFTASHLDSAEQSGNDNFLTGFARFNLFPQSRFPFEMHYESTDSRVASGLGPSASYDSKRIGMSQRYRPADAGFNVTLSYDHNTQDSSTTGEDVQDLFELDAGRSRGSQTLSLNANWNRNRRLSTDERTLYQTLVLQHRYGPSSDLSIQSVANFSTTENDLRSFNSEFDIAQLSSFGFWRDATRPLTVSGGVRVLSLSSDNQGNDSTTRQASADVGANYLLNPNARVNGSVNLSQTDTGGETLTTTRLLAGLLYQGDTKTLGRYSYDWYTGGDITHTTASGAEDVRDGFILGTQLGHSFSRVISLSGQSKLTWKLSQSGSGQFGAVSESTSSRTQLLHGASIMWSKAEENTSSFVRLSANDSRFIDGSHETFQLINLQATRTTELGQYASWSGNLTVQSVHQQSEADGARVSRDQGFVTTASADLTYQRQNLFGVRRLRFFSQLRINRDETLQLLGAPIEREERSWENRLEYAIGRLESRLVFRLWESDGERRSLLMWRLIRQFGD